MKIRFKGGFFVLFVSGALSLGANGVLAQYAGPAVSSPPRQASAPEAAMRIDYGSVGIVPGDLISISALGIPEFNTGGQTAGGNLSGISSGSSSGIRVGSMGEVVLPYLGIVKLSGMTTAEASQFLAKSLKGAGILTDPQVSIQLMDSPARVITVLGEVVRPSPVSAFANFRLLDVIAACGGFTPSASHAVTIRRVGEAEPIVVEIGSDPKTASASNIPLLAGDTVLVSKVGSVFVMGQVKTSAAIPLTGNTPMTVMRALTIAGGVNYGAALSKARIIRTTSDNRHIEIMLDLKKLIYGKQQDVALFSDDILFVPTSAFKEAVAVSGASVASTLLYQAGYLAVQLR